MRLKFQGDTVVSTAGTRDEIPQRVSAAQIQNENQRYWNEELPSRGGPPVVAEPEPDHFDFPERITVAELSMANAVPGIWRTVLGSERIGRRVAVFGPGVDIGIRDGGRRYHLDAQIERGQEVLSLPAHSYVIEERDGNYIIWSFEKPSDPGASAREHAIAKLQQELSQQGNAHSATDAKVVADTESHKDVERIRALSRRLAAHNWGKHPW